jgi:hypothetical protein
MPNVLGFLSEDSSQSSMRLIAIGWAYGILIVWMLLSLKQGTMAAIDGTIIGILATIIGGKVGQKFAEVKRLNGGNGHGEPQGMGTDRP